MKPKLDYVKLTVLENAKRKVTKMKSNIVLVLIALAMASGCANDGNGIDNMRDPDFGIGCLVIEGKVGFDSYFKTTTGGAEICKLKCSDKLPANFCYKYDNARTGCHVIVGCNNNDVENMFDDLNDIGE